MRSVEEIKKECEAALNKDYDNDFRLNYAEVLHLTDTIERLTKERNAAIEDLKFINACEMCSHKERDGIVGCDSFFKIASQAPHTCGGWEWSGVKEDQK